MGRDGQLSQLRRLSKWRCRSLRIAFNLKEPKPPNVIPSIVKNLRFGGFGVFRLILSDLMEL